MARDRHALQILEAQKNTDLPPTCEMKGDSCRILKPDPEMSKLLGRRDGPMPTCPETSDCPILSFISACEKPVEIEIGSGMGRFLVARAKNHPDTHFIGIELERVRIAKTDVDARTAGIKNLSLICAEAMNLFEFCLPDASITAVYLFFPDPWPKARHEKKRIFKSDFLNQLHRVLKNEGLLHVATDFAPYFTQMNDVMAADKRFSQTEPLMRTEDELTDFELKFLSANKPTYVASWYKNDNRQQ